MPYVAEHLACLQEEWYIESDAINNDPLLSMDSLTILALGFFLGLKHALDADHIIAVATIISERKGMFSTSIVGLFWGVGHTIALLIVGCSVVALGIQIPERMALGMEFLVASMLILLGLNVLWKLIKGETVHMHVHTHHDKKHFHLHSHPAGQPHEHLTSPSHHRSRAEQLFEKALNHVTASKRSLLIGMVHGMAGSAALMLLILTTISDGMLALAYIAVFGIGSIGGMLAMSTILGLPFTLTAQRSRSLNTIMRAIAGGISVALGIFLAWHIGVVEGLFIR
ncbi:MAG: urease accessory protein UreH [Ignavibacteria bacterium]